MSVKKVLKSFTSVQKNNKQSIVKFRKYGFFKSSK